MACADYAGDLQQAWVDGAFIDAVMCPFTMQIGDFTFGMFVIMPLLAGLTIKTESIVIPASVTMMLGTIGIAMLPSGIQRGVGIALVLATMLALWLLVNRIRSQA